ncbi:Predicted acetyltransferase [Amycolatopsis arida]|uniref:Predicted acetyltransferase n=1 Tax=Amycolatopsis arida TaxID=587909 RepID=A0A1I5ZGD7_9PSEU|nr:GNAT family N-acetyltransferase [Amycolatopsis arida]TDX89659.1 putative acetyltransferase [Amycolatopsis arida]SFQ55544.1 Predicted acetyltransferase [Amycolatopsis arida]
MTDIAIRTLADDELREASRLFRESLHVLPVRDEDWPRARHAYQPDRTLGAHDDGALVGTARSFDATMTVPGGRRVPMAAVTGVGVRADHTRRGVLTELMRAQLTDLAEREVPLAGLYASEAPIYGRFGYGSAMAVRSLTVARRRAVLRDGVPHGGTVELLRWADALEKLPGIYAGLDRSRAGLMSRPEHWWVGIDGQLRTATAPVMVAVHSGPDGPDGFAVYSVSRPDGWERAVLKVDDLHAGTDSAFAGLWRFLLRVDLVEEIELSERALDEPVELLVTDTRAVRVTGTGDGLWLRLVDVPAALAARHREGGSVTLEVLDPVLPANTGTYLVSADEVRRTDRPAQLRLDADTLAMAYLGTWAPSTLAATGRIEVLDPAAPAAADRLFAAQPDAWCGTFF